MRFPEANIQLSKGLNFSEANSEEVLDFLKARHLKRIEAHPSSLSFQVDEKATLILQYINGKISQYPVRESFIAKFLNWYRLPHKVINDFEKDLIANVLNGILTTIKSDVTLVLEDNEALTILSKRYSYIEDQIILNKCLEKEVHKIDRNDFFTRIYINSKNKIQAVPDDIIGCGLNVFNSETGLHAFEAQTYLLRLVCSNGAIAPVKRKGAKLYHYNVDPQIAYKIIDDTLDDLQIISKSMENSLI